jgi:hypothetical protein
MVRWLEPTVLADAALRVVVSAAFGAYADKRELQAFSDVPPSYAYDEDEPLWLDFVADLGDGFDATYAIACLLGRERLELSDETGERHVMPRGRALVMGGDQVYPAATRKEYENRFRGPYGAAFPGPPPADAPHLFAIPGNHDWYDGLTNFLRFFCSQRDIGAWKTVQRRSYFALRLPRRWWLLALDIQLDTYIDEPQLTYFAGAGLQSGDRVILVTGKPSWVKVRPELEPDSYKNLRYFMERVIAPTGAEVRLTLTGDLHHYFRYDANDGTQLVTAGGGGAYLFPTHTLPEELSVPTAATGAADAAGEDAPGTARTVYTRRACFPPRDVSARLAWGALRMQRHAPGLCVLIAVLDAIFAIALFAALDGRASPVPTILVGALIALSLIVYAAAETLPAKLGFGLTHAAAQLVLAAIAPVVLEIVGADGAGLGLVAGAAAAVIGFALGGPAVGLYLVLSHRHAPKHANEVLACQGIPDYKGFLRLRIDEQGVTIYPVGLRHTPRRWAIAADDPPARPWLRPADGDLDPELIEPPIHVPPG